MNNVRDVSIIPQQADLIVTQRPTSVSRSYSAQQLDYFSTSTISESKQRTRVRKPSPGLAARLKALGFGKGLTKPEFRLNINDRIGRIPEAQINKLDNSHRANSTAPLHPRGRTWSGNSGLLIPQRTHRSYTEAAIVDKRMFEVSKHQPVLTAAYPNFALKMNADQKKMDLQTHRVPQNQDDLGLKEISGMKHILTEKYTPPDRVPPFTRKDVQSESCLTSQSMSESASYFNPLNSQRSGSIYTLSRVSFASQLAQLTSLQLPDAESLSSKVSAIPTSIAALRALMRAAYQIRSWISKASEVISGLDGDDDVEWAAAGGREGLEEVDHAITRFEELINVYVAAIELLRARADISSVPSEELRELISQVEVILTEWDTIKKTLKEVKTSVEMAMEWEELWNTVLGDIGVEMDQLKKLVFEMEENRYKSVMKVDEDSLRLAELETIVEETQFSKPNCRFSTSFVMSPMSPDSPDQPEIQHDESSLLALFARMQPLRASLDFFPMRLSAFLSRAENIFPTACEELGTRLKGLEVTWDNLKNDAESLRKELGEDRWVLVFRAAGGQAQKIYESVEHSFVKLTEVVHGDADLQNEASIIALYEKKKNHFGPAIEQILSIIDQGVKNRLTVNGEILRLHSDMQHKWETLKNKMTELDAELVEFRSDERKQQPRKSISSIVSNDHSTVSSLHETPRSSPASSIIIAGHRSKIDSTIPGTPQPRSKINLSQSGGKPNSLPVCTTYLPRKSLSTHLSTQESSPISPSASRQGSATPTASRSLKSSLIHSSDGKPRWNCSTRIPEGIIGHGFKPLSLANPSPSPHPSVVHSNRSASQSKIPMRSPLSRGHESLSLPEFTPSRPSNACLSLQERLAERISNPSRSPQSSFSQTYPMRFQTQARSPASDLNVYSDSREAQAVSPPENSSSKANRRVSLLPQPRRRKSFVLGLNSSHFSSTTDRSSRLTERKPFRA